MASTAQMIRRLEGMLGSPDLNDWETGFVSSLLAKLENGEVTELTEKQLDHLVSLHDKHFA